MSLTDRELAVLRHLAAGKGRKEIAPMMGWQRVNTVDTYVLSARRRLGARTVYQAVAMVAVSDAKAGA